MRVEQVGAVAGTAVLCGFGVENRAFVEGAASLLGAPAWSRLVVVERAPLEASTLAELADRFRCPVVQVDSVPTDAAVVVRSPGFLVPPEVVESVPTTNPAALWLAERRSSGGGRTVGVTGTKGKSSSTTLLAEELARRKVGVFLGGNVGTALWTRSPDDPVLAVAELSSYQAIELRHSPDLAAITGLGEDHLDLHGTVEAYHQAKLNVVCGAERAADVAVVPRLALSAVRARCPSVPVRIVAAGPDVRRTNAAVVAELLVALGQEDAVDEALVDELVAAYPVLPGRYHELVGPADARVRWVDDALASNPAALVAALHRSGAEHGGRRVVVVAGGRDDRGVTTSPIVEAATALDGVCFVCIDAFGERLAAELGAAGVEVGLAVDLEAAVHLAAERAGTGPATVVFSPGAPTPLEQGSWKDRSARLAEAIAAMGEPAWR